MNFMQSLETKTIIYPIKFNLKPPNVQNLKCNFSKIVTYPKFEKSASILGVAKRKGKEKKKPIGLS